MKGLSIFPVLPLCAFIALCIHLFSLQFKFREEKWAFGMGNGDGLPKGQHVSNNISIHFCSKSCLSCTKASCTYFTHGLNQPISIHILEQLCHSALSFTQKSLTVWVLASQVATSYYFELQGVGFQIFKKTASSWVFVSVCLFVFCGPKKSFWRRKPKPSDGLGGWSWVLAVSAWDSVG